MEAESATLAAATDAIAPAATTSADPTTPTTTTPAAELPSDPSPTTPPLPIDTPSTTMSVHVDEDTATFLINGLQVKNEYFTRKIKSIIADRTDIEVVLDNSTFTIVHDSVPLYTTTARHLGNYGDVDTESCLWAWNESVRAEHAAGPNPLPVSSGPCVMVKDKMYITYILATLAQKYEHIYQTGTDVTNVYGLGST